LGGGEEAFGGMNYFCTRFEETAAIERQFSCGDDRLAGGPRAEVADREFGAIGEAVGDGRAGPGHDFVKQGGCDAAVDDAFESGVVGGGGELGLDFDAVAEQLQAEAEWVLASAGEAGLGMGQRLHGGIVALLACAG